MKSCDVDKITLSELYDAITHKEGAKHNVIVPIFQRGKSWDEEKELDLIESIRLGLPIGAMLVYRRVVTKDNDTVFEETLIDGLQRSNTIKKYIEHPLMFTDKNILDEDQIAEILQIANIECNEIRIIEVKEFIADIFKKLDESGILLNEIEVADIASDLLKKILQTDDYSSKIDRQVREVLKPYVNEMQREYEEISKVSVPLVVYSGDDAYLPTIFNKINSKGVKLSDLEIYSATWPTIRLVAINNDAIVNSVLKKYDELDESGFTVEGYKPDELRKTRCLTTFEYVFGLSKYITQKYDFLSYFEKKEMPDTINSLAFELLNACLNQSRKDKDKLYENLLNIKDINQFERCLLNAINFVQEKISLVTAFKGNLRTDKNLKFHGKFQIMSLIANTFREMYDVENLNEYRTSWEENKKILEKNIVLYYVYDVINDTWRDGGTSKIYTFTASHRYLKQITFAQWNNCLDTYFENSNMNPDKTNPNQTDKLILNCIYIDIFSYKDHAASEIKFDIEHLATKEKMKDLKAKTKCPIAIGNIGNLCYLKEGTNREKHDKTIYQYEPIANQIKDIEEKYSFTKYDDLKWIEDEYSAKDKQRLQSIYYQYLKKRFEEQKKRFFASMNIEMIDASAEYVIPPLPKNIKRVGQFIRTAMKNLSDSGYIFSDEQIADLCSIEWCQKNLATGKKIPFAKLHEEGMVNEHKDGKDNIFNKTVFRFGNHILFVKQDLFNYNREPFIKWYLSLK